ncbi:MAG: zinc/iron-chelating domain-containing protein [Firmicutes bacterium HGW-Firmicutes-12]|jgi:Fe-S-cluster containining protein|nr:MAG: zinc/iron-chelating domain-containing protein [Firmicutes bacterium HGW-Firmicutes-12]
MKVRLLPYYKDEIKGIDIEITGKDATVADYLDALDTYILAGDFIRLRDDTNHCEGCDTCCGERMPLTSIDVFDLKSKLSPELSMGQFFNRYTYVAVIGRNIDIMLARDFADKCILLDKEKKRCTQYEIRPLVCRTYICTLFSPRADRLRLEVVNTGEDQLVRQWLQCYQNGECVIHEEDNPRINLDDWQSDSWIGKSSYAKMLLQDILTPKLWSELTKKGENLV